MRKKILGLMCFMLLLAGQILAQGVTTASINGVITDESGEALPGANIVAVHQASGTRYGAVTNLQGRFVLPNLRVGAYTVSVSFIGYEQRSFPDINLSLGQNYALNLRLQQEGVQLNAVEVIGRRNGVMNSDRTGASTNLSRETINELPTISRSINDFTRLTPQSNGTSFAGRDNRFNNYTIDGNIYNNNFGLGSGQFAGANPLSLDAIEEVQVNLAPYDVRQGGFTGANVNAITRSGTNRFEGSAYYLFRNDQLIGNKAGDTQLDVDDSQNTIRGFRLGGPLLRDRLFFFVSYEQEEAFVPSFQKRAARDGLLPDGLTVSRVPAERLDFVSNQLNELYGYQTGPYEGYDFEERARRFNLRLDFNISQDHKLALRYNNFTSFRDVPTNGNSIRFIGTRYSNTNRTGIEAMNFRNSNYTNDVNVQSFVAELNSRLGHHIANQLNVGYTSTKDPRRGIPGQQAFPFIEVLEPDAAGNPLYYFSVGNELFSVGNLLENNTFNITNNMSIFSGNHTFTLGGNFEYMTFQNAFNPVFNGFYRYIGYDKFVDAVINRNPAVQPDAFAQSYAFDGMTTPPVDETRFAQLGIYVQDEFQVTRDLKLTGGFRVDLPIYPVDLPGNPRLDALNKTFTDPRDGETIVPDVSQLPRLRPLWSPRVGFNWDVHGDRSTQLRGGTGVFSGRIPFVWISNQVNGNGVTRGGYGFEGDQLLANPRPFNPDVDAYRPDAEMLEAELSNELNITDRNFRLPQTWRTNFAVDQVLPGGIIATLEAIYSRDVSTPIAVNPVLAAPDGELAGADQRPTWSTYSDDPDFRNVFYLTNARQQGDYYSLTAQLQKRFENGFSFMAAYTRSRARDYGLDGGSQAISLWSRVVKYDRNNPEISYTRFDQPNRIVGSASYSRHNTTLTLFYQGGDAGRFSYTYSGDFGDNALRLIYVPKDPSEINFQEYVVNGQTITTAQQQQAFFDYVEQDDYLRDMKGQIVDRNGARLPWVHQFDLRILNNIPLHGDHHKLQLSIDFMNFNNLLNSAWGIPKVPNQSNLLNYRGTNEAGEPLYRMNLIPGTNELPTETFRQSTSLGNTWRAQLGIRYLFH